MERNGIHQKQKLLYPVKILCTETDGSHSLSPAEITQFFGRIAALMDHVRIAAPDEAAEQMKSPGRCLPEVYRD